MQGVVLCCWPGCVCIAEPHILCGVVCCGVSSDRDCSGCASVFMRVVSLPNTVVSMLFPLSGCGGVLP